MSPAAPKATDIAIIGFGFCGLMTLAQVVQRAQGPLAITVFDNSPHAPKGPAYATPRPEHLLNVRASGMSAWPDNPDDFVNWCQSPAGQKACQKAGLKEQATPQQFMPRRIYGDYLGALLDRAMNQAASKHIQIEHQRESIRTVTPDLHLQTQAGGLWSARHIVCASGFHFGTTSDGEVIRSPWQFPFETLAGSEHPIAIIGTGLTAADILISLKRVGFAGPIRCLSRNGRLPMPHAPFSAIPTLQWPASPRLSSVLRTLGAAARAGRVEGMPWQSVMEALRPNTAIWWKTLPSTDQSRILKRYFSLWNHYRHRMAPELHAELQALLDQGQLKILRGRYVSYDNTRLHYETAGTAHTLTARHVFDCRGPSYFALPAYLPDLVSLGMVQQPENHVGIATNNYVACRNAATTLWAMGSLLLGQLLETTAVPELRLQAACIAEAITAHSNPRGG